jgi:lysophospholipase
MEKYEETIGELNQRGFDVFSLDWRGQGLSSRLLPDRQKGFVATYKDYLEDLYCLFHNIVMPEARPPLMILAHSMGGHIALRFLHDYPDAVERAVCIAPMIEIFSFTAAKGIVRLLTQYKIKQGLAHEYVICSGAYNFLDKPFKGNRLTSDPERFKDEKKMIEKNPALALGGVTYGWLAATLESIDIIKTPGYTAKIKIPVLMVIAGADRVVSVKDQKWFCSRMNECRHVVIQGARHEILREADEFRKMFWMEFDTFTANQKQG